MSQGLVKTNYLSRQMLQETLTSRPGTERPQQSDITVVIGRCGFTENALVEGWEINIVLAGMFWRFGFATEA